MTMAEAQERSGLTRKAIRYYIEAGLIDPPQGENGYYEFGDAHIARLRLIRALRDLGVPVSTLKTYVAGERGLRSVLAERAEALSEEAVLVEERRRAIDRAIAELPHRSQQDALDHAPGIESAARESAAAAAIEPHAEELRAAEISRSDYLRAELERLFPGEFGEALGAIYGPMLDSKLETAAEREAWAQLTRDLDELEPISIPNEVLVWVRSRYTPESLGKKQDAMWSRYDVDSYEQWESETIARLNETISEHGERALQERAAEQRVIARFFSADGAPIMAACGRWLPALSSRFRRFGEFQARFMQEHPETIARLTSRDA